jgi:endonuclease/exonuclease/phosphatase (EEP) superfamily protein YafD
MDKVPHRKNLGLLTAVWYCINIITFMMLVIPSLSLNIAIWWLDNLISLQLQWSLLAILLLVINLKMSYRWLIVLTTISLIFIINNQQALYFSAKKKLPEQQVLKLAQLNIHYENSNIEELLSILNTADYDLLVLQEVGDNRHQQIQNLSQTYPYSIGTSASPSGLVLFSKWPIVEKKIHDLGYTGGHIIEAIIQSPETSEPIQIFSLHPTSPRNETLWQLRNVALDYVAKKAHESPLPYKIIIGDLNTTPWSLQFKQLQKNSMLINSANGFGYIPSWSFSSINKLMRIISSAYIDHCLISDSLIVINKRNQTINGTDHLLLITELAIPKSTFYNNLDAR